MSIFLSNLKEMLDDKTLSSEQVLYMVFKEKDIDYPIEEDDLLDLVVKKHIVNNKLSKTLFETKKVPQGKVKAKFINDISKEVSVYICERLCLKDKKTGFLQLPNDETDLTYTAEEYLGKEHGIALYYWMFLFMFPSKGDNNKRWEKVFLGDFYTGVPLRIRSKFVGNKFLSVARNKDMGAFLLATYRFIQGNIHGNKAFITTMPKYIKDYREWYDTALADIKKAKDVKSLFKSNSSNTGVKNVIL